MKKTIFEGMTKGKQVVLNEENGTSVELDSIQPTKVILNAPTHDVAEELTKDDVWGVKGERGMMVARYGETCPHFGDVLEYKSYTFVCKEDQFDEVCYWLEYVLGGECISATKEVEGELGHIAIRADYMCW